MTSSFRVWRILFFCGVLSSNPRLQSPGRASTSIPFISFLTVLTALARICLDSWVLSHVLAFSSSVYLRCDVILRTLTLDLKWTFFFSLGGLDGSLEASAFLVTRTLRRVPSELSLPLLVCALKSIMVCSGGMIL